MNVPPGENGLLHEGDFIIREIHCKLSEHDWVLKLGYLLPLQGLYIALTCVYIDRFGCVQCLDEQPTPHCTIQGDRSMKGLNMSVLQMRRSEECNPVERENPAPREVLEEIFLLLEEFGPNWYTERLHERAKTALGRQ